LSTRWAIRPASSFNGQTWRLAKKRAGLERLRWHDLRHTAVALAIEQGAHAKAIQERMGHSSIAVTLDRYGHLLPSIEERIAVGLEESYRRAAAVPTQSAANVLALDAVAGGSE
jgi:integrase